MKKAEETKLYHFRFFPSVVAKWKKKAVKKTGGNLTQLIKESVNKNK